MTAHHAFLYPSPPLTPDPGAGAADRPVLHNRVVSDRVVCSVPGVGAESGARTAGCARVSGAGVQRGSGDRGPHAAKPEQVAGAVDRGRGIGTPGAARVDRTLAGVLSRWPRPEGVELRAHLPPARVLSAWSTPDADGGSAGDRAAHSPSAGNAPPHRLSTHRAPRAARIADAFGADHAAGPNPAF